MQYVRRMVISMVTVLILAAMPGLLALADGGDTGDSPLHHKRVADNGNGTYTLTLDVTGNISDETKVNPADILVIVDMSGSMEYGISNRYSKPSRITKMRELMNRLSQNLLPEGSQNRMAVIQFSGDNGTGDALYDDGKVNTGTLGDGGIKTGWTNDGNEITNSISNTPNGGTNWEAGFYEANSHLGAWRENAKKYVIFISDGNPNFHYAAEGDGYYTGGHWGQEREWHQYPLGTTLGDGSGYDDTSYARALAAAGTTVANKKFFSVGIGGSAERMGNFANDLNGTYYNGVSAETLDAAFDDILENIQHSYKGVKIEDTLSAYADMAEGTTPVLTAKDSGGKKVDLPQGTQVNYDGKTKELSVIFPKDYALVHGATYTVSCQIRANAYAHETYAISGYDGTGEDDTGATSSGKPGFFCNTSAKLYYNDTSCDYQKPVIQVYYEKIKELPPAGGSNMAGYIVMTGALLAGISGILLIIRKRKIENADSI